MIAAFRMRARPLLIVALLATATLALSACAPLIVGGAAATATTVATDRRTTGIQLEDKNIVLKAENQIIQQLGPNVRVNAMAYNRRLLLIGDVPTEEARNQATAIGQALDNVITVSNQMRVGPTADFGTRSRDTWLTSKVKSTLLNTKYVPSGTISVISERGVVYMMGKVTQTESEYAASAVASINGVDQVVKFFEIISREEAIRLGPGISSSPAQSNTPSDSKSASTDSAAAGSGVEIMPIK